MSKKLTLEDIKAKLLIINPNIQILSKEYKNNMERLECKCLNDGHIWFPKWNDLQSGKGCLVCSGKLKLTLEEIKKRLKIINPNIEILSKEYINNSANLDCKCLIDGNAWSPNWMRLSQGQGCPECAGNIKLNLEEIIARVKIISPNILILSKEYKNSHTKLKLKCLVDGNEWITNWANLSQGRGCPKCGLEHLKGKYHHNWKGGISPLHEYLRIHILHWKYDSFNKYKSKCDITGSKEKCIIHHLYNFSDILIETMETLNLPIHNEINKYTDIELKTIEDKCTELHYKYGLGVCLCEEEHKLFHSIYSSKNNTKEQYIEFKEMRLKQIHNQAS